jgi:branched-chain amino acid transport system ATP-binding protein
MLENILEGKGVGKSFGGLVAIKKVDFCLRRGEIRGLIGPNGAGKTTMINCISGFYHYDSGEIKFGGIDIRKSSPDEICRMGIARTFQIPKCFGRETVLRNVVAAVAFGRSKLSGKDVKLKADEVLEFTGLSAKQHVLARELTISSLKRLGISMALATRPELLLLDEPMGGLNPAEIIDAIELIKRIRNELNINILLVEHVMRVIMNTCDQVTVISFGEKICEGSPREVGSNPEVIRAYLGEEYVF